MQDKKSTKKNTKRVAIVGGTVAALMGGGIAFAAWTSTGTGLGSAMAGTDVDMTVSGTAPTGLYPTGQKTMTVVVTNNNAYKVRLDTITAGAITVDSGHPGCTATNSTVTADSGTYNTANDDVAAGANTSRDLLLHMGAGADEACKGATFTVSYTASAHSVS